MGLLSALKLPAPRSATATGDTAATAEVPSAKPRRGARPSATPLIRRLAGLLPEIDAAATDGAPGADALRRRARTVAESLHASPDLDSAHGLLGELEREVGDLRRSARADEVAADQPAPPDAGPAAPTAAPPEAVAAARADGPGSPPEAQPPRGRRRAPAESGVRATAPPPAQGSTTGPADAGGARRTGRPGAPPTAPVATAQELNPERDSSVQRVTEDHLDAHGMERPDPPPDPNRAELRVTREREIRDPNHPGGPPATETTSGVVDSDGARVERATQRGQGSSETTTTSTASLGADGLRLEQETSTGSRINTSAATNAVTVNQEGVGFERETSTGREDRPRTTTVGAQAAISPTQGVTGLQTSASRRYPSGVQVTTAWGYSLDLAQPVADGRRWKVDGTWTLTGSVGAGVSQATGGALGANVRGGRTERFSKHFESEAEAKTWRDRFRSRLGPRSFESFRGASSANDAQGMAVGDQTSTSDTAAASLAASVSIGGIQLGAVGSHTETEDFVVTRLREDQFRVRERRTSVDGGGVTGGVGSIMSAGMTSGSGSLAAREVEFTLPAGQAALDDTLRSRCLPRERSGPGWREVERSQGTTEEGGMNVGLLGFQAGQQRVLTDEWVTGPDGKRRRRVEGVATSTIGTVLPAGLVEGTPLEGAQQVVHASSDTQGGLAWDARSDGANARDTQRWLADATGLPAQGSRSEGQDSGEWTTSAQMDAGDLNAFIDACQSGTALSSVATMGVHSDQGQALVRDIRAAGNRDAKRAVVVRFINQAGTAGLAMIRAVMAQLHRRVDQDVELAGSEVWEGADGRARLAAKIDAFEATLQQRAGLQQLLAAVEDEHRKQVDRLRAMRDPNQYPDLLLALRQEQIALNEPLLARLTSLLTRVRASQPAADRGAALRAAAGTSEHNVSSAEQVQDQASEQAVAQRSQSALSALAADERRMFAKRDAMNHVRTIVMAEHQAHMTVHNVGLAGPAIERLADDLPAVASIYRQALQKERAGQEALEKARSMVDGFERLRPQVPRSGVLDATASGLVDELRHAAWTGHDDLERARAAFAAAHAAYRRVRNAVPADRRSGWFGSTQLPDL